MHDNSSLNWTTTPFCTNLTRTARILAVFIILLHNYLTSAVVQPKSSLPANGIYKCYQSASKSDGARETCYGRLCVSTTHLNTNSKRLWCQNQSEPGYEIKVNECVERTDGSLPDQVERTCVCTGDYCNGAPLLRPIIAWTITAMSAIGVFQQAFA